MSLIALSCSNQRELNVLCHYAHHVQKVAIKCFRAQEAEKSLIPLCIRRCFDVDIRLKQHRDVDNEISTLFQRCSQDVASTL